MDIFTQETADTAIFIFSNLISFIHAIVVLGIIARLLHIYQMRRMEHEK